MDHMTVRLDAAESVFFKRQLESIDQKTYEIRYPALRARQLVPTQPNIPDWAHVYTWREVDKYGSAKIISNAADDLPRSDVKATESSKTIKLIGAAYGYDFREIKAAAAMNVPLDALKAAAARFAIESEIDRIISLGSAKHNLEGILSLSGISTYTLKTKTAGGLTWGTVGAPNATGLEMAQDLMGFASALMEGTKGMFASFRIVLPIEQYNCAASTPINPTGAADVTALTFAMKNCPFIESVEPWLRCDGAGAGGLDRMAGFPADPMVVAGIVPMEYTPMPVERRNLEYVVDTVASCGGVVCRYPIAVKYADGL